MSGTESPTDMAPASPSRPETKRRKVRRGTHSCWECKRRKIRCSFAAPSDHACVGCRRRGATCLSQQDVDERAAVAWTAVTEDRRMGDRMVRVEALVERLASQVAGGEGKKAPAFGSNDSGSDMATSVSPREMQSFDYLSPLTMDTPFHGLGYEPVSAALYAALPPQEEINLVIRAGLDVSLHRLMTSSLAVLSQYPNGFKAGLADIPHAGTHPTLLAKYMLILATCLQSAHPEANADEFRCLSVPPHQLMRRLVDTATSLVTSKDEFLGSIEGLECIMLESVYLANSGDLRRAWFVCRRAMVVAQMLGLHRGDKQQPPYLSASSQTIDPSFFWFRIVCTDRQLCLMLGLPQGTLDVSMATATALATDSPSGRFERKQCVIASRILTRNESLDGTDSNDFAAVLKLDAELQQAANEMPSKWWLIPNLASSLHNQEKTLWEMLQLIEQMLYFNLLNLLHLPYMLRSSNASTGQIGDKNDYEYSKLASINASRELLTRYIMLRSLNRVASACRSVDFFAITAAMTLVMSHLGVHKQRQMQPDAGAGGLRMLAYQRNSDRAMMEKVLENMKAVAKLSTDFLSKRSAALLEKLLALEAEVAEGKSHTSNTEDGHFFRLGIPYFGTIRISSEGDVLSMDTSQSYTADPLDGYEGDSIPTLVQSSPDNMAMVPPPQQHPQHLTPNSPPITQLPGQASHQLSISRYPNAIDDALNQQYPYPGLTAHGDEWMFQSTDTVFFDNLIRGPGMESVSDTGSSWTN
nr:transcription factor [Phaeosphaeriaceae sp. CF-150626]